MKHVSDSNALIHNEATGSHLNVLKLTFGHNSPVHGSLHVRLMPAPILFSPLTGLPQRRPQLLYLTESRHQQSRSTGSPRRFVILNTSPHCGFPGKNFTN
jgi:hypothetical protein